MDTKLLTLSMIEIFTSVVLGIFILYITWSVVRRRLRKKYKFEEFNLAFSIFCSGIFFSVGNLMTGATQPVLNTLRVLNPDAIVSTSIIWNSMMYVVLFISIGLVMSLIVTYIGLAFFNMLTRDIDEIMEITKNNIGIAILVSTVLIIISMFAKDGYVLLLESLIPYPATPTIY